MYFNTWNVNLVTSFFYTELMDSCNMVFNGSEQNKHRVGVTKANRKRLQVFERKVFSAVQENRLWRRRHNQELMDLYKRPEPSNSNRYFDPLLSKVVELSKREKW